MAEAISTTRNTTRRKNTALTCVDTNPFDLHLPEGARSLERAATIRC